MRSVLERMARVRHQPLHHLAPQEARAAYETSAQVLELPRRPIARVEDLEVPAADGARLPARLYQSRDSVAGVLLYLHGGGFTIGSVTRTTSSAASWRRSPVAQWFCWVIGSRRSTGTAARQDSPSHRHYGRGGLVLEQARIEYFFGHCIGLGERDDWRFAPLNADDVEGVAPAWIGLAECDPLFDEGIAYADKLRGAGVPVELEVWRGVTHEFIKMGRAIPEAREAHAAARALANAFLRTP